MKKIIVMLAACCLLMGGTGCNTKNDDSISTNIETEKDTKDVEENTNNKVISTSNEFSTFDITGDEFTVKVNDLLSISSDLVLEDFVEIKDLTYYTSVNGLDLVYILDKETNKLKSVYLSTDVEDSNFSHCLIAISVALNPNFDEENLEDLFNGLKLGDFSTQDIVLYESDDIEYGKSVEDGIISILITAK